MTAYRRGLPSGAMKRWVANACCPDSYGAALFPVWRDGRTISCDTVDGRMWRVQSEKWFTNKQTRSVCDRVVSCTGSVGKMEGNCSEVCGLRAHQDRLHH